MKNKFISLLFMSVLVFAHQPVMDMAPRWSGGYGFQIRHESFGSDRTINDKDMLSSYYQQTYWLEGVYTWHRSKRITFKLPYHKADEKNGNIKFTDNAVGDLILAVPLKKYSNLNRSTQNFGFTPQVRIPLLDEKGIESGHLGAGVSLAYTLESFSFYQFYDVFGWVYDDKDDQLGLDVNLGIHPYHNNNTNTGVFLIWDLSCRWEESSTILLSGPVLMPYRQNMMARLEVKFPVVENGKSTQLSRGLTINTGIGFVF